jgi:hypothetical protein
MPHCNSVCQTEALVIWPKSLQIYTWDKVLVAWKMEIDPNASLDHCPCVDVYALLVNVADFGDQSVGYR